MKKKRNIIIASLLALVIGLTGCSSGSKDSGKTLIYTNADEEAIEVMKETLDKTEYKGKYTITPYGSSELAGKMEAENKKTKADILAFSTFHLQTLEDNYNLFEKNGINTDAVLDDYKSDLFAPFLVNTGAIFYNEKVLKDKNLPVPTSLKDLADPKYKGEISFPNLADSTTGWLMVQALLDNYAEKEAKRILEGIKSNAGVHIEASGSGPIKKVEAGEVAIGFGLRHQATKKASEGLPIGIVDPIEGNYTLTESFALIKDTKQNKAIIEILFNESHKGMLEYYPSRLFVTDEKSSDKTLNPKTFKEPLTKELLNKHIEFYNK